nr:MAG TPA: hypothetical protein [Caudoviricetes sp.]
MLAPTTAPTASAATSFMSNSSPVATSYSSLSSPTPRATAAPIATLPEHRFATTAISAHVSTCITLSVPTLSTIFVIIFSITIDF